MLEGLFICQGLLQLCQLEILTAKSHILEWQESIPVQGMGCWWHRVVILYFGGMASYFWYLKGHPHLPGEFLYVILAWNFLEFLPPGQCVQLLFVPVDPLSSSLEEGSGIEVCWGSSSIMLPAQGASPPDRNSWMRGLRAGGHLRSSSSGLASGLDQSDHSPIPSSSPQVRRGVLQLWYPLWGCPQTPAAS